MIDNRQRARTEERIGVHVLADLVFAEDVGKSGHLACSLYRRRIHLLQRFDIPENGRELGRELFCFFIRNVQPRELGNVPDLVVCELGHRC